MTKEAIMDALNRCEPYVIPECCGGCPYEGCWGTKEECITQLHADTYALLKAQEPVKPLKMEVEHVRKEPVVFSYQCPVCMCGLQRHWVACPICGTGVKWE